MSSTHHGEFTLHVFLYIARLIAEQRYPEVLALGIRRDQAEKIRKMTTEDLHEASRSIRGDLLNIRLDPDALDKAFAILDNRKRDEDLVKALMMAGARYDMMHALCGMSTEEYARQRQFLELTDRGRPEIPSDAAQTSIWKIWSSLQDEPDPKQRYLEVHRQTKVPAGTIWKLISEWEGSGFGQSPRISPGLSDRRSISANQKQN